MAERLCGSSQVQSEEKSPWGRGASANWRSGPMLSRGCQTKFCKTLNNFNEIWRKGVSQPPLKNKPDLEILHAAATVLATVCTDDRARANRKPAGEHLRERPSGRAAARVLTSRNSISGLALALQ